MAERGEGDEPIEDVSEFGEESVTALGAVVVEVGGVLVDVRLRLRRDAEDLDHTRLRRPFLARSRR